MSALTALGQYNFYHVLVYRYVSIVFCLNSMNVKIYSENRMDVSMFVYIIHFVRSDSTFASKLRPNKI